MKIAGALACSEAWLLTGNGEPSCGNVDGDQKHVCVVEQFTDKAAAILANEDLVSIERISPDAFNLIVSYIKGVLNGLKMSKK